MLTNVPPHRFTAALDAPRIGEASGERMPPVGFTCYLVDHLPQELRIRNIRPHQLPVPRRQRGSSLAPVSAMSTERAHCRPSRIAHTTRLCPRRMSPQAKIISWEVA